MKIVLIYLPHPYLKQPDSQIPLGLLYLASLLERDGMDVLVKNYSTFLTHQAIEDLPKADLYGITATSVELLQANRFAYLIKEKYPSSRIGLGGPGAITDEFVDGNVIDFICKGEGELVIKQIVYDLERNCLNKIYVGEPVLDLDTLPLPARHLLKDNLGGNVFAYNRNYFEGGSTVLLTSRGCPHRCAFCANPKLTEFGGGKVRFRSVESVRHEILQIMSRYKIRQFRISDDQFTTNKRRMVAMCEMMSSLDMVWRISARTKFFDYETAKLLYDGGCREVSFGVESFDDSVLKRLNKGVTAAENVRGLEMADKAGLMARALFMIRTPGQTAKTVPINIKWLKRVPYNIAACTVFMPMPGSDIWYHPDKYGIEILNHNLDDYNFYFYNSHGARPLKDIIRLKGRDMKEVNEESLMFKNYLEDIGKLNTG